MDDFTVPAMLSHDSANFSTGNSIMHHHHTATHTHKDHMLAAGNGTTIPFIYDLPNHSKTEASLKHDYRTATPFGNCIEQQAALHDASRPTVVEPMDGVSFSAICDMPSLATLGGGNDARLHMGGMETPKHGQAEAIAKGVSSSNLLDNNAADLQADTQSTFTHMFLPRVGDGLITSVDLVAKSSEDNSRCVAGGGVVAQQQMHQTLPLYMTFKPTADNGAHHMGEVSNVGAAAAAAAAYAYNNNNSNGRKDKLTTGAAGNDMTEQQITTTATATIIAATATTTTATTANTSILQQHQQQHHHHQQQHQQHHQHHQQHQQQQQPNKIDHNNVHEPTIKTTTTTATTSTASTHHNITELASANSSTATKAPNNTASSSSNSTTKVKSPQDEAANSCNYNSSNVSSDCESLLSSEEFIELETNESGYQDNTSSQSQQNASGGGGGGGGGGGSGGTTAALLNGVGGVNANASAGYMSLLPPAVGGASSSTAHLGGGAGGGGGGGGGSGGGTSAGTSSTSAGDGHMGGVAGGSGIDFKHLFEELCPVCGDKVSGYHYGLLTCESCKGFFKRTVQNKKVYTCVAERSCHIDKTQRKRCPYCRFQKCLEVGMKLEAVRADRMRGGRNKFGPMYKRDRARKLQVMRQRQLALQALRTSIGSTADMKPTPLSPGYQQTYANMNIKQEIQIPQVSSLTQSPDSSPSPIAIALGQVTANAGVIAPPVNDAHGIAGSGGGGGGSGANGSSNNNNNPNSDSINSGGGGGNNNNCHDTGTAGSLQNSTDSKLCFDSGTHPSSTADSIIEPLRVSPMIRDFVQSIDDREWQTQLFALLQKQTYNQVEVDLFELMCKVLDQNLFSQVDWARNTVFFKDLKVDDQMKLLQHSWSDMLVLDHLHQRIHNGLPDETQLNNGQVFNLLWLGLLGVPQLADYFNELQNKLQDLKFDMGDYVCMKFLILLNPDVRGIINKKTVLEGHENVQAALLDYTLTCYPSVTDKFRRLLNILPDIHAMASRGEEHLYSKHCAGSAPTQTLLMEMLHAKRKV